MGPSSSAVDLPRPRVELELGRRRHRRMTVPGGLLLFVSMLLPAVHGCNEPVYPLALPMFWHPYIYGAVLAFGALFPTVRGMRRTVIALRVLAWLTILGSAVLATFTGAIAFLELLAGGILLGAIGRHGYVERRVALTTIAIGALSLVWFGLWAASPGAMIGVYVSAIGSAGTLVGGLVWLGESS